MKYDQLFDRIAALHLNLYRMSVWDGEQVFTRVFAPSNRCTNCYSVAKVFVVTALGFLWDEKRFDVNEPILKYLRNETDTVPKPEWEAVTIEQAIEHTIGFREGFLDIDADDVASYPTDDYLKLVLLQSLYYVPGMHYQYTDAAYYLLSRLVTALSHEKLDSFLWKRLLKPMGFTEAAWSRCPFEYPMGATGLYISTEDMLKIARLYLQNGVYGEKRYLSQRWVDLVFARNYELHPITPGGLIGKGGMFGQGILADRSRNIAAAWQGHTVDKTDTGIFLSLLDEAL